MIKIGKNISEFSAYSCQPKTKEELEQIVNDRIEKEGPNCDLNDIDTSLITDMSELFYGSKFTGDISGWDVSKVKYMRSMFRQSKFNQDISKWNISDVKNMSMMFAYSKFDQDISRWDVSNVKNLYKLFFKSDFNKDVSNWNIDEDCDVRYMFDNCPIKDEFKPKALR